MNQKLGFQAPRGTAAVETRTNCTYVFRYTLSLVLCHVLCWTNDPLLRQWSR